LADNVVQITVSSKNSTKAGFAAAKADAESAATGIAAIFDKMGKNVNKHLAGIGSGLGAAGGILGAGSGLLAMAGPIGAAALALGAFGAVAIPVIKKVTTAQTALTAAQAQYTAATTGPAHQAALANAQASVAQAEAGVKAAKTASAHASALTALANAQRHYQQVASNPAAQNALRAEAAATKGLNGSQMQMMGTLNQLKGVFTQVENAMSPLIESVLKLVVGLVKDLMPSLPGLATAGAAVIKGFLEPFTRLVKSFDFGTFIGMIVVFAQKAGPLLGTFLVRLLAILMQLFVQTMPTGLKILKLLLPAFLQMLTQMIPIIAVTAQIVAVSMKWLAANKLLVPALWLLLGAFVAAKLGIVAGLQGIGKAVWAAMGPWAILAAAVLVAALLIIKYHKQIWEFITRIWGDIAGFFKRIWGDIKNIFLSGVRFIVDLWLTQAGMIVHAAAFAFGWIPGIGGKLKDAAKAFDRFRDNVNRALGGVQGRTVHVDVVTALGGSGQGQKTKGFASGTSGASPGWWWAGEEGPELVYSPHGGETVVPHGESMRMARGYARGVGIADSFPSAAAIAAMVSKAVGAIAAAFARSLPAIGAIGGAVGGTAVGWLQAAMRATGAPGSWLPGLVKIMMKESGGNPRAYNPSGDASGHAEGLMQMKPGTYAYYATSRAPGGIWNPVSNAAASIRYIRADYGSPYNIPGIGNNAPYPGYRGGTGGRMPPLRVEIVFRTTGTTDLDRALMSWLKKAAVDNGGGNVQAAFGS